MRGWNRFAPGVRARARHAPGTMNGTERAYVEEVIRPRELAREILWWAFECQKLSLGIKCWYEPDFLVVAADGTIEFHEIKRVHQPSRKQREKGIGERVGWEEDARVKIKAAASRYPFYRFLAAARRDDRFGGGWEFEEIKSDGAQVVQAPAGAPS